MPRFAKILSSGSPAEVTSITVSELPNIVGNDQHSLIFADTGGKFYSSSKIYLTGSNELVLEDVTLSTFTITASGIPDELTDRSSILFINEDGGFETTSSLRYISSGNKIAFDGVFSGSFTGDGSGITGVIGNTAFPLTNGAGIGSSSYDGSNPFFSWNGSEQIAISVLTASFGGLAFSGSGLQLDPDLAGNGLTWSLADNYSVMAVDLNGSSNGTSGLKLTAAGLAISDNIAGEGLDLTGGSISIDLAGSSPSQSGLLLTGSGVAQKLRLADSLAGNGLKWANSSSTNADFSVLEIDPTDFVSSSAEITFRTGSTNLILTMSSGGTTTAVAQGFRARLKDEPLITYDVSNNLVGDFTINGDFETQADTTLSGSQVTLKGFTFIQDPFPIVNSGSANSQGGIQAVISSTKAAYLIYDDTTDQWYLSNNNINIDTTSHTVTNTNYANIVTSQVVDDTTSNIESQTPTFGTSDPSQAGQIIVQANPSTGESPLFIYA